MSSMEEMAAKGHVARIAACGDPGTAKTGAIAAVVNTGKYNLRIIDLDGNTEPLFEYIKPEFWPRVNVQHVEEDVWLKGASDTTEKDGQKVYVPIGWEAGAVGAPRAYRKIWQLVNDWPDGIGPVKAWTPNDILMVDSGTPIVDAVMRKARYINKRADGEQNFKDYMAAQADFMTLFERLKSRNRTPCHLYVTFHRKLFEPERVDDTKKGEPELNKDLKERAAAVMQTKWYPNTPGKAIAPIIGGYFSTLLSFETVFDGERPRRVIRTVPKPDMDVKLPVQGLPALLPVETGLVRVFEALDKRGV